MCSLVKFDNIKSVQLTDIRIASCIKRVVRTNTAVTGDTAMTGPRGGAAELEDTDGKLHWIELRWPGGHISIQFL